jgi:hypothetical protein
MWEIIKPIWTKTYCKERMVVDVFHVLENKNDVSK